MKEIRPELIKDKKQKLWAEDILKYVAAKTNVREIKLHPDMFDFMWEHVREYFDDEKVNRFVYCGVPIVRIKR